MKHRTNTLKLLAFLLCILTLLSGCTIANESNQTENTLFSSASPSPSAEASDSSSMSSVESQTSSPGESTENTDANTSSPTSQAEAFIFSFDTIPAYAGSPYVTINNNIPVFSQEELSAVATEKYSALDALGRCGVAFAVCGNEIMPKDGEERGSISHVKPSGWVQAQYDCVDGKYLYNRCHLLGWQLSAENDNKSNLITGTRYMNTQGMLPFENMIADYIHETGNHVAYRVTPRFKDKEPVARGVELEAYSVEDQGDGISFHVYVYNLQPQITIDYATGKSSLTNASTSSSATEPAQKDDTDETSSEDSTITVYVTPTGKRYHLNAVCGGKNSKETTMENALAKGLTPCQKCAS